MTVQCSPGTTVTNGATEDRTEKASIAPVQANVHIAINKDTTKGRHNGHSTLPAFLRALLVLQGYVTKGDENDERVPISGITLLVTATKIVTQAAYVLELASVTIK